MATRSRCPRLQQASSATFADLFAEQRRFWLTVLVWFGASTANYGVFLWGPTIVALLLGVAPQEAAKMFIYVSLAGVLGRTGFAFLAHRIGRKPCGQLMGYGTAVTLALAAYFHNDFAGSVPLFLVFLIIGAVFFDGGVLEHRALSRGNLPGPAFGGARSASPSSRTGVGKIVGAAVSCVDRGGRQSRASERNRRGRVIAGVLLSRRRRPSDWARLHVPRRRAARSPGGSVR